ncbi:MAG: 30S ribosomal protein S27e [Candidatus Bathyarchaeia archaeon]
MAEWEKLIPRPKSVFVRVKCLKCGNEQIIFSHAVNRVTCNVCGVELAEPSGGRAAIKGEVVAVFE